MHSCEIESDSPHTQDADKRNIVRPLRLPILPLALN
jgi:hypothetical protein